MPAIKLSPKSAPTAVYQGAETANEGAAGLPGKKTVVNGSNPIQRIEKLVDVVQGLEHDQQARRRGDAARRKSELGPLNQVCRRHDSEPEEGTSAPKTTTSDDAENPHGVARLARNLAGRTRSSGSPRSTNVAGNLSAIDAERTAAPTMGTAGEAHLDRRSGAPFRRRTDGTSVRRSALRRHGSADCERAESAAKKTVRWADELDTRNWKGAKD